MGRAVGIDARVERRGALGVESFARRLWLTPGTRRLGLRLRLQIHSVRKRVTVRTRVREE
jgi:hypothetical protein